MELITAELHYKENFSPQHLLLVMHFLCSTLKPGLTLRSTMQWSLQSGGTENTLKLRFETYMRHYDDIGSSLP